MRIFKNILLSIVCAISFCGMNKMLGEEAKNQKLTITAIFKANGESYIRLSNRNTFVINKKTDSFWTNCTNSISNWLVGDTVVLIRGESHNMWGEKIKYPFEIKNIKTGDKVETAISNAQHSDLDDIIDALILEQKRLRKKISTLQNLLQNSGRNSKKL